MKAASNFLVVGEALVDVIHRSDGTVEQHPGGSPTNVAVGLARLGRRVGELCYLARDAAGDLLRDHLRSAGVRELRDALDAPATSVADVRLDEERNAHYDFSVLWDVPPSIDWAPEGEPIDAVHTGSIALALEPGAAHVLQLLRSRPDGVRVSIDPNVRPAFLPADGAAARLEPFFELTDLVKLSDEDAAYLYPGVALDAVLDRLLGFGAGVVAITRGGEGAVLATATARVAVGALAHRVEDTVGAGDSFMAGLLDAIATLGDAGWAPDARQLAAIAEHAARASAITVGRAGADLPWRRELPEVAAR